MNHPEVILCLRGGVGGVDVFSCNLVEELIRRNVPARIVLTKRAQGFLPSSLPIDAFPIEKEQSWRDRWKTMIHYLESRGPCIFLPNYEFHYSVIAPKLSEKIIIVGIVHSDDAEHYNHLVRLGRYWNAVVAVSHAIAEHIHSLRLPFSPHLSVIRYGVTLPPSIEDRSRQDAPLRIVYVGRLTDIQKRVTDLPEIFQQLIIRNVRIDVTIIGDGPARAELERRCRSFLNPDQLRFLGALSNQEVLQILNTQDIILLTSEYEGLPISILEAMGRGCIPVVFDIKSGIPEVITNEFNGFIVSPGDGRGAADKIRLLEQDIAMRRSLSRNAYETIRDGYSTQRMTDDYLTLFDHLIRQVNEGKYHRPKGRIHPPPDLRLSWKQYLPPSIRAAALKSQRYIRKMSRNISRNYDEVPK